MRYEVLRQIDHEEEMMIARFDNFFDAYNFVLDKACKPFERVPPEPKEDYNGCYMLFDANFELWTILDFDD